MDSKIAGCYTKSEASCLSECVCSLSSPPQPFLLHPFLSIGSSTILSSPKLTSPVEALSMLVNPYRIRGRITDQDLMTMMNHCLWLFKSWEVAYTALALGPFFIFTVYFETDRKNVVLLRAPTHVDIINDDQRSV